MTIAAMSKDSLQGVHAQRFIEKSTMKAKKSKSVEGFTLTAVAAQLNCVRETARRKFHAAGISVASGKLYTLAEIVGAFATSTVADERAERIRLLRAQARKTEIENRKSEGELVEREPFVADLMDKIINPFRRDYLALAKKLGIEIEVAGLMATHFQDPTSKSKNENQNTKTQS